MQSCGSSIPQIARRTRSRIAAFRAQKILLIFHLGSRTRRASIPFSGRVTHITTTVRLHCARFRSPPWKIAYENDFLSIPSGQLLVNCEKFKGGEVTFTEKTHNSILKLMMKIDRMTKKQIAAWKVIILTWVSTTNKETSMYSDN